ncbi:hypothetical protein KP509_03G057000 [Ceratopteris richardii]|uniref:Uncharacterized protein n=1 Tax=Ceratopteris richardii TaxID=49495 RepID=A0A8T2V7N5_CERRI|nr:hypothetical protein KP509_03G057000 [Ceratopteris richardii]
MTRNRRHTAVGAADHISCLIILRAEIPLFSTSPLLTQVHSSMFHHIRMQVHSRGSMHQQLRHKWGMCQSTRTRLHPEQRWIPDSKRTYTEEVLQTLCGVRDASRV